MSRTAELGDALLRWTYRYRWWLRGAGLALLALGVLLVVSTAVEGGPVAGPVFATAAWASQVVAWGWFAPALGRTQVEAQDR